MSTANQALATRLAASIRDVPDFPKPGVVFKDITPVLLDVALFRDVTAALAAPWVEARISHVLAIESRGFLFGAPVAQALGVALVPVRKPGKLPRQRLSESYELEYGRDTLEMHADALSSTSRVLIIDDVLATGGTAAATRRLALQRGADVVGIGAVIDLAFLPWRALLAGAHVETLVSFS